MPLLGLIGYPLGHTFSPAYFKAKFNSLGLSNWSYEAFPIKSLHDLPAIINNHPDLVAFNVTIPYKTQILPFCDTISEAVEIIGASNLICISRNDDAIKMHAHNTDVIGFSQSLVNFIDQINGKAVIFGTGGSSKAVAFVLNQLNIDFDVVGRQSDLNYYNVDVSKYQLFINCTPVGMSSDIKGNEVLPLNYLEVSPNAFYFDLIYNPEETATLRAFKNRGVKVKNGLEMLHLQADAAWEIVQEHLFNNVHNTM